MRTDTIQLTIEALTVAFTTWERRYREDPEGFEHFVRTLQSPPESYGAAAAAYLVSLLREQA